MRLRCALIGLGVVIPVWKVRHVSMAQYLPVAKLIAATPLNVASWMARHGVARGANRVHPVRGRGRCGAELGSAHPAPQIRGAERG
jgi:hypothetical protein